MRTTLPFLLAALLFSGCSSEEDKRPCPPNGLGVEEVDGVSIADQIANFRDYNCTEPQICPDIGGRSILYIVDPKAEAAELSFLITNCSVGNGKLEIERIELWGDEKCHFQDVSDTDIQSKSINPRETSALRTVYKPKVIGEDHAEVRIFSNATNFPTLRLRVCGLAADEPVDVDAGVAAGDGGPTPRDAGAGGPDLPTGLTCKAVENFTSSCHTK